MTTFIEQKTDALVIFPTLAIIPLGKTPADEPQSLGDLPPVDEPQPPK